MRIRFISTFLCAIALAAPAIAQDTDGDGVLDSDDNCIDEPNASQTDTNYDGFGNACDADYWNDGLVDEVDFEIFVKAFGSSTGNPNFNPDVDSNDDGVIGVSDFGLLGSQTNGPPGPSGLSCATVSPTTIPCAAGTPDTDGDGVGDLADNCVDEPNASQDDSNLDGIGTACDPDYNNDGDVDDIDYEIFANAFGSSTGAPNFNPDCDHNGDGVVGAPDFGTLGSHFGVGPGPNGAGTSALRDVATSTLCDTIGCP